MLVINATCKKSEFNLLVLFCFLMLLPEFIDLLV